MSLISVITAPAMLSRASAAAIRTPAPGLMSPLMGCSPRLSAVPEGALYVCAMTA